MFNSNGQAKPNFQNLANCNLSDISIFAPMLNEMQLEDRNNKFNKGKTAQQYIFNNSNKELK